MLKCFGAEVNIMPQYTLDLFKLLLDKQPAEVDTGAVEKARADYERFASSQAGPEEIEQAMIEYGKKAWPLWQAEVEMMEKYAGNKLEDGFLSALPEELKKKWKEFKKRGGSIEDFRHGREYEQAFTAEEDHLIEEALVKAEQAGRDYIKSLIADGKTSEYHSAAEKYKEELGEILAKLEELELLKEKAGKWSGEIDKEIYFFEKGFAELEERPSVKKVQEKIDWYSGQIEAGNV